AAACGPALSLHDALPISSSGSSSSGSMCGSPGEVVKLASVPGGARGLAVAGKNVYWTAPGMDGVGTVERCSAGGSDAAPAVGAADRQRTRPNARPSPHLP